MKKKLVLALFTLCVLHVAVSAQLKYDKKNLVKPYVSEYEIEIIEARQGIDLLIMDGNSDEGLCAAVEEDGISKLKIELQNGKLRLSKRAGLPHDERISVFININGSMLRSLQLHDDAFASSRGVLNLHGVDVQLNDNAQVSLRTKGKLMVQSPAHYKIFKEQSYYALYSVGR